MRPERCKRGLGTTKARQQRLHERHDRKIERPKGERTSEGARRSPLAAASAQFFSPPRRERENAASSSP
ncbi:hypothetical protein MRX96_021595 [Rhipicephalus microplus]